MIVRCRVLALLMILTALPLACTKPATRTGAAMMPYEVKWGTSGGFTGSGEGYVLYGDGRLARWKQTTPAAQVETQIIGTISQEAGSQIERMIDENSLLKLELLGSGNITTTLTINSAGQEYRISWPGWPGQAPKELATFMARLQAIVELFEK